MNSGSIRLHHTRVLKVDFLPDRLLFENAVSSGETSMDHSRHALDMAKGYASVWFSMS